MSADGSDSLIREYRDYDRRCDVVSCFEVFFTEARQMVETVEHFERFPRFAAGDGNPATPDFTVRFTDGTLLIGEIAKLARAEESLDSLVKQLARYAAVAEGPCGRLDGGGHQLGPVSAVDLLVPVPIGEANAACDRLAIAWEALANNEEDDTREVSVSLARPCTIGYSYDDERDRMVFTYSDRAGNPRPRSHGRTPSVEEWLISTSDTLRCGSERFSRITAVKRFMNDRPPAVYTATLLWLEVLPVMAGGPPPIDISVDPAAVASWLRQNYGWGDANAVRRALEFLERAGLARQRKDDWHVGLKPVANNNEEVRRELVDRYLARPSGPVSQVDRQEHDERRARARDTSASNRELQERLDFHTAENEDE